MRHFYDIINSYSTYTALVANTSSVKAIDRSTLIHENINADHIVLNHLMNKDKTMGLQTSGRSHHFTWEKCLEGRWGSGAELGKKLSDLVKKTSVKTSYVKAQDFLALLKEEAADFAKQLETCTPSEYVLYWLDKCLSAVHYEWYLTDTVHGLPEKGRFDTAQVAAFLAEALKGDSTFMPGGTGRGTSKERLDLYGRFYTIGNYLPEGLDVDTATLAYLLCRLLADHWTFGELLATIFGAPGHNLFDFNFRTVGNATLLWSREKKIKELCELHAAAQLDLARVVGCADPREVVYPSDVAGIDTDYAVAFAIRLIETLQQEIAERGPDILVGMDQGMEQRTLEFWKQMVQRTLGGYADWKQASSICADIIREEPQRFEIGVYS